MTPSNDRWPDERLVERFNDYDRRFARVEADMAELRSQIVTYMSQCQAGLQTLERKIDSQDNAQAAEKIAHLKQREIDEAAARLEKKKDRRYIVASLLTTAGIIVAAFGVIQGYIG